MFCLYPLGFLASSLVPLPHPLSTPFTTGHMSHTLATLRPPCLCPCCLPSWNAILPLVEIPNPLLGPTSDIISLVNPTPQKEQMAPSSVSFPLPAQAPGLRYKA